MNKNIFVFVVCGSQEHIDTLHFSLKYLKKHSKNEIYIVTDPKRNEIEIFHDAIIGIDTPVEFNHHQASIYLKTGLHKFLTKGNNYCYLDTDVIALTENCDLIFSEFISPIRFAPDHCVVPKFSSYAVNCGCFERWEKDREAYKIAFDKQDNKSIKDPLLVKKSSELMSIFETIKTSRLVKLKTAFRYFSSISKFQLNDDFFFDKKKRTWHISTGDIVLYETDVKKIEKETGLRYSRWKQKWYNEKGEDIWENKCDHLVENIKKTFNIEVEDRNWQHWNGGVFLFNDLSHDFLEAWHQKTMKIFTLPDWKTRDQGTLIATVWEFGLQKTLVLNKEWNFLADYNNLKLGLDTEGFFTDDEWKTKYKVNFIHVYHHFGDKSWDLWRYIESV